jgi:enoyl-[acyl-carrier protein] reductase III
MSATAPRVLSVIAQVTRYPAAILTPDASLEDDLGIDSVKQAEILAVLGRELGLTAEPARGSLRTIGDVIGFAEASVPSAQPPLTAAEPTAAPVAAPRPPLQPAPAPTDHLTALTALVARVTRYPEALLTADADLEDELGIDSVKQAEIMVAVTAAFPEAEGLDARREGLRTLGQIATALAARAAPVAEPAPRVVVAAPSAVTSRARRPHAPRPLEGKVALVTGSGRGIGRTIAEHLGDLGCTVVINAFHSRDEGLATTAALQARGVPASFAWGSVANEAHVEQIFAHIEAEHGRLDLLVCNASDGVIGPFDEVTPKDWDRAFRTCIVGTHQCALRAAKLMTDGGCILTLSTVTAHRYLQGFGSQGVVKAAVESLTRYLACELAPRGIRANCVSAGPVYGPLLGAFPDADNTIAHWERITPGGELCSAQDVAEVVAMLASDAARRVNGAVWVVDNGVSLQIDGRAPARITVAQLAAR